MDYYFRFSVTLPRSVRTSRGIRREPPTTTAISGTVITEARTLNFLLRFSRTQPDPLDQGGVRVTVMEEVSVDRHRRTSTYQKGSTTCTTQSYVPRAIVFLPRMKGCSPFVRMVNLLEKVPAEYTDIGIPFEDAPADADSFRTCVPSNADLYVIGCIIERYIVYAAHNERSPSALEQVHRYWWTIDNGAHLLSYFRELHPRNVDNPDATDILPPMLADLLTKYTPEPDRDHFRWYQLRMETYSFTEEERANPPEGAPERASGLPTPVRVTTRYLVSPDNGVNICEAAVSLPLYYVDSQVEWADGVEPSDEQRDWWAEWNSAPEESVSYMHRSDIWDRDGENWYPTRVIASVYEGRYPITIHDKFGSPPEDLFENVQGNMEV